MIPTDTQHPWLDGSPVMIGDLLEAHHPDAEDGGHYTVQFHVGSITWDRGRYGRSLPAGWTVAPVPAEDDDLPYEWPITECRRPHPAPSAGHQLTDRLAQTAQDLDELHPDSPVARDIRQAISRIRLAERAACEALGRRDLLRPAGGA